MIKWLKKDAKVSYSQSGEDLIVDFIFQALKIDNPTYLDIGAHHPSFINNTFFFYEKGCVGVCVEPDPTLFEKIKENLAFIIPAFFGGKPWTGYFLLRIATVIRLTQTSFSLSS